ncbi:MAG: hypothetical protein A2Z51_03605 [Deltaproteobacteria bacterium RBG_19FT_COMBO_52_11]|nr:MAG: hypothetical protein A2Z51_03605 [Deltaproteobacteria bacterium RBG_19FT_COMBO_52_11]
MPLGLTEIDSTAGSKERTASFWRCEFFCLLDMSEASPFPLPQFFHSFGQRKAPSQPGVKKKPVDFIFKKTL